MALQQSEMRNFRTRLRQRAAELGQEIRATLERSSEESHVRIAEQVRDSEDDSFSNLVVDLNYSEIERDADELRRIEGSLRRLSDGTYGTCIDCGKDISVARLKAEPTAARCIECQEIFEKTHAGVSTPKL
jgi:DnaK suppressor protein